MKGGKAQSEFTHIAAWILISVQGPGTLMLHPATNTARTRIYINV